MKTRQQVPLFFVIRRQEEDIPEVVSPPVAGKVFKVASAMVLMTALFFVLAVRVAVIRHSYEIETLKEQISLSESKLIRLNYRYAALTNPSELRSRALHELNMVTPSPNLVTVVYD